MRRAQTNRQVPARLGDCTHLRTPVWNGSGVGLGFAETGNAVALFPLAAFLE
jgi:hypothetical protein